MDVLRYAAFSDDPGGGNPAGVVLDARGSADAELLRTAAEVGYSETAFLFPRPDGDLDARYFSPLAEVPFCGHATIAAAVAHAQVHGAGRLTLHTPAGIVPVTTELVDGRFTATLTSVDPRTVELPAAELTELLACLDWSDASLDPALPPRVAYAGAWHPIVAVSSRARLARLDYDLGRLGELMARWDWTTIALVHRESPTVFHARNPFPPGGVIEDPATGAAAAALGGYLRELGAVTPPADVTVLQGFDLGRPGVLSVHVPESGGIRVRGSAVRLPV